MKSVLRLLIPLALILCVLAMGCTQPAPAPVPVPATPLPVATTLPVPVSPTAQTCSLTPGPTQQVPEDESVSITVNRNTISENPTITTRFNGG
ncbi:MAG: hypothetical protein ACYDDV_12135, partial [Methanoregula sp.]